MSELLGIVAAAGEPAQPGAGVVALRLTANSAMRKVVRLARLRGITGEGGAEPRYQRGATHLRPTYRVILDTSPGAAGEPLADPAAAPPRSCCRRAFLRGAFLVGGTVARGSRGYHLEFELATGPAAAAVEGILRTMDAPARARERRRWEVYLKGSDAIAMVLATMGASQAVLHWEETRLLREVRGRANRVANSETANLRKSVATGLRQLGAARRLARAGLLESQPAAIREIAHARVAHPSASLHQLAQQLGLSRSAVNQRLRRLLEVADSRGLLD